MTQPANDYSTTPVAADALIHGSRILLILERRSWNSCKRKAASCTRVIWPARPCLRNRSKNC